MNNNYYLRNSVTTYTVQKGDSLYSISKKFNTTPTTLMMLNNLSNTLLNIGQVLIVKKEEEGIPEHIGIDLCGVYQGETEVSDPIYDLYTVKKGDSRSSNLPIFHLALPFLKCMKLVPSQFFELI